MRMTEKLAKQRIDLREYYPAIEFVRDQVTGNCLDLIIIDANLPMQEGQVISNLVDKKYELPDIIPEKYPELLDAPRQDGSTTLYNRDLLMINSITISENGITMELGTVKYFDMLRTNRSLDIVTRGNMLRDELCPPGTFSGGKKSMVPIYYGVCCLINTSDNKILLQKRSNRVHTAKNLFTVSAGGFGKLPDVEYGKHGPFTSMYKQIEDELSITRNEMESLELVEITRKISRGGTYNFYFMGKVDMSSKEVLSRISENIPIDDFEYSKLLFLEFDHKLIVDFMKHKSEQCKDHLVLMLNTIF